MHPRPLHCTVLHVMARWAQVRPDVADLIGERTKVLRWLLQRVKVKEFDPNKQYASEILAILLQGSTANQRRVGQMNGVDMLLQVRGLPLLLCLAHAEAVPVLRRLWPPPFLVSLLRPPLAFPSAAPLGWACSSGSGPVQVARLGIDGLGLMSLQTIILSNAMMPCDIRSSGGGPVQVA